MSLRPIICVNNICLDNLSWKKVRIQDTPNQVSDCWSQIVKCVCNDMVKKAASAPSETHFCRLKVSEVLVCRMLHKNNFQTMQVLPCQSRCDSHRFHLDAISGRKKSLTGHFTLEREDKIKSKRQS